MSYNTELQRQTYSIQKPAHSAIPSTDQNPVFTQITEEMQSGGKKAIFNTKDGQAMSP